MPATYSAGLLKRIALLHARRPAMLVDIQAADGTLYCFGDSECWAPSRIPGSTRIQSAGGSSIIKYYNSIVPSANGVTYAVRGTIKNQGSADVSVRSTSVSTRIFLKAGQSMEFDLRQIGNGVSNVELIFETANAADAMDIVSADPFIGLVGQEANLLSPARRDFSAWYVTGGTVITLTQGVSGRRKYTARIKSAGPFRTSKTQASDAGDLVLDNTSGNTVRRDISGEFRTREFFHAMAIFRIWEALQEESLREFYSVIKEPQVSGDEMVMRLVEILDPTQYTGPFEVLSEQCGVEYKGPYCGSASGLAACPRTMAACVTRGAVEHFAGVPFPTPETSFAPTVSK